MSPLDDLLSSIRHDAGCNADIEEAFSCRCRRDARVNEARMELAALREWKATQQSALIAASARLLSTGCAKGPGLLDAIDSVCAALDENRKRVADLERERDALGAKLANWTGNPWLASFEEFKPGVYRIGVAVDGESGATLTTYYARMSDQP